MLNGGISEDLENAKFLLNRTWEDSDLLLKIKKQKKKKRIDFLVKVFPEIKRWSDLERNWYLVRINQTVNLGICRFFHFSEFSGKQYCIPIYKEASIGQIKLKMNGLDYSFGITECNCDLLEVKDGCRKENIFR